jgi:hypothetical protein
VWWRRHHPEINCIAPGFDSQGMVKIPANAFSVALARAISFNQATLESL